MGTIDRQAHMYVATELLELMNIAAILALTSDCIWVVRDMKVGGVTGGMVCIAAGLFLALIIAMYGATKYHMRRFRKIKTKVVKEKLKICKLKAKHTSKHEVRCEGKVDRIKEFIDKLQKRWDEETRRRVEVDDKLKDKCEYRWEYLIGILIICLGCFGLGKSLYSTYRNKEKIQITQQIGNIREIKRSRMVSF